MLGFARDNVEFFQRAIAYLTDPPARQTVDLELDDPVLNAVRAGLIPVDLVLARLGPGHPAVEILRRLPDIRTATGQEPPSPGGPF